MKLNAKMTREIVGILKTGEAHCQYAAARIEQLEEQLKDARLQACKYKKLYETLKDQAAYASFDL